jgi:predicted aspartyl protease
MTRRLLLIGTIALAVGSALYAQTQTTKIEAVSTAAEIDKTTQTEDVRFKTDLSERLTVPVRLSGTGPYRFLVDTGADRTAISRQLARRLGFAAGEMAALHSVAGVTHVSTATVPTLQLTSKEIRNINAPLLEGENMGADGILGVDSLRAQRVMFDFEAKTMSIVPAATPDFRAEPGTIVVQATRRNGRLLLTEATANGHSVVVVLDTGSQVSIGNEALRKALLGNHMLSGSQQVVLESVTGEKIVGDYMFVKELEIGGIGLKNLAIVFTDAHTFKQLRLDRTPALLLGMNAMRAFKKVSIDFANKKLRVLVPEHSQLDVRMAAAGRG